MFKKKSKPAPSTEVNGSSGNPTRTVVTETVETKGGCQTTTRTVITASGSDDIESALKKFNIDPAVTKGSCVTKKIVYTSSGQVMEETVETQEISPTHKKNEPKGIEDSKGSKSLTEKFGLKSKKSTTPKETKTEVVSSAPPATATKKSSPAKTGQFQGDCLKSHNEYRKKHGVPTLQLSSQLCSYSQEWADHLAKTDTFQHRTEKKYGENIYMKWSSDPSHMVAGNEPVDSWYSEIKDHTFGKEPRSLKSGHFTQVIWKQSKEMGVAWARSKSGKILVVANYNPAGNFVGTFSENVPPPK